MKKINALLMAFLMLLTLTSCFEDQDDNPIQVTEINDFVWKGMNLWYFWQAEVDDLADDRFASDATYTDYLNSFESPDLLFEDIKFTDDRFSWISDDYYALNNALNGTTKSNGLEIGVGFIGDTFVGVTLYVLPNSDASDKNIQRGDLFLTVNGQQLTLDNYRSLLFNGSDTYILGMAEADNSTVSLNGTEVTLTKEVYTENPVFIANTFTVDGIKVGYLMYNRFTDNFDGVLNNAFATFVAEGINELVVDFRYNLGGSVTSAINISSMIAGRPTTDLFFKQRWNAKIEAIFNEEDLERNFVNALPDGTAINSLGLNKVYILATGSSASASELVINGLDPYINVIHIGDTTVGKNEFSITLHDIPSCGYLWSSACNDTPNPNHTWAMQPLVGKNENSVGFLDYADGFTPDIDFPEDITNLGVLGDVNEPLLARAIQHITGNGKLTIPEINRDYKMLTTSSFFKPTRDNMYINPDDLQR